MYVLLACRKENQIKIEDRVRLKGRDSGNRMAEVKVIVSGHLRQLSCNGLSSLGGLSSSVWVLKGDVVKITGLNPLGIIS